jgi:hypothetical protein
MSKLEEARARVRSALARLERRARKLEQENARLRGAVQAYIDYEEDMGGCPTSCRCEEDGITNCVYWLCREAIAT